LAWLAALEGQPARALTLAAAAEQLRVAIGEPLLERDQVRLRTALAPAHDALSAAEAAAASERGRLMGLERAVAFALAADDA
jgi:hypothetical protein